MRERSKTIETETDFTSEGEFDSWILSVEASLAISSKKNLEEENLKELFAKNNIEVILASANCFTHDITLDVIYRRPKFSNSFIEALTQIEKKLMMNVSQNEMMVEYVKFTRHFGPSFITKAQYGSSMC